MPNNKKWLDIIRNQEQSRDHHQAFHTLLYKAEDPFSLVADYFGKGVFKKLMVITEWSQLQKPKTLDLESSIKNININGKLKKILDICFFKTYI